MPRIQFKKPEGGAYTPLPEGTYDFEIKTEEQKTASTGNPQLELLCEVSDGPLAGRTTRMWYSLTEKSTWRVMKLLDATGCDYTVEKDENGDDMLAFNSEDLIGRFFRCRVTIGQTPAGNDRNEFGGEAPSKLGPQPEAAATTPTASAPAPASTAQPAQTAPAQGAFQPRSVGAPASRRA